MSRNYEDDTLDILRYIATHMKGYKYKDNANKENLRLLEEGLVYYTIDKLKKYGIVLSEKDKDNTSLYNLLAMLNTKIPKEYREAFFFQYLNGTNLILSAMQDDEIDLKICDGKNVEVKRNNEDNSIKEINIGRKIKPAERVVELVNILNNVYEKEISK